jgi:hypothetical protein
MPIGTFSRKISCSKARTNCRPWLVTVLKKIPLSGLTDAPPADSRHN